MDSTVLVVDDDPMIVAFLTQALEEEGYQVVAASGDASLGVARDVAPDVILLDVVMPGVDGVEMCQRLRADPATAEIPIIAMSAGATLRSVVGQMPVNGRLTKPFELQSLFELVAYWSQWT